MAILVIIGKVVAAIVGLGSLAVAAYCYFWKDPWVERMRSDYYNERK